ncbi:hypothetical protein CMMCAS04_12500 [Clavibacter michiganensis subsp. michiganensis]|nr:hypothetical protein CMMCAS04_12500 [Clavibacter michiganensis subsp. michiganensis]
MPGVAGGALEQAPVGGQPEDRRGQPLRVRVVGEQRRPAELRGEDGVADERRASLREGLHGDHRLVVEAERGDHGRVRPAEERGHRGGRNAAVHRDAGWDGAARPAAGEVEVHGVRPGQLGDQPRRLEHHVEALLGREPRRPDEPQRAARGELGGRPAGGAARVREHLDGGQARAAQRDGLVRGGRQHEVGLAADGEGHAAEGAVEAARGELHPGIRQPGHRAVDGRDGGCEEPAPRRAAQEEGMDGVQRRDPPLAPEPQGGRREPVLGVREDEVGAGPVHQRAEVAAGGGVGADHRQAEEGHGQGGRDVVEGDARPVQLADGGRVGCRDGDRVACARERERLLDDGRLGPTEVGEGVVHHEEGSECVHRG